MNLVLAPDRDPVPFLIRLDGAPPGEDHGLDADPAGAGTVDEPRMYQLIRQRAVREQRTFEITFQDQGLHAYVFTFG